MYEDESYANVLAAIPTSLCSCSDPKTKRDGPFDRPQTCFFASIGRGPKEKDSTLSETDTPLSDKPMFWLGSVSSTVPELALDGEQRHPYCHRPYVARGHAGHEHCFRLDIDTAGSASYEGWMNKQGAARSTGLPKCELSIFRRGSRWISAHREKSVRA